MSRVASSHGTGDRIWLPGLLLVTALAYANGLAGPLQFDDHLLESDPAARDWGAWGDALGRTVRPLLKASFILSRGLGEALGSVALGHHLVSLAIHLAAVALAFRLARDVHAGMNPGSPAAARAVAAGCAAVLALHPLATEAVTYISGRSVALATAFCLAALILHGRGRRAAAAACFAGAVLSREAMIMLPAVLLLRDWAGADRPGAPYGAARLLEAIRSTLPYWVLAGIAALWLALHSGYENLVEVSRVIVQGRAAEPSLLPALEYFAVRLALLAPLSIDPDFHPEAMGRGHRVALALGLAVLGGWSWRTRSRCPQRLLGLGWILAFLAPVYLFPLRHDPVSDRHFYPALWGAGFIIACEGARLAARGAAASRVVGAAAGLLAAGMLAATLARNADYGSEAALWEAAARASPGKPRVFHNLGVAYMKAGRFDLALPAFERALELDPGYRRARENRDRARIKLETGNPGAEPEI